MLENMSLWVAAQVHISAMSLRARREEGGQAMVEYALILALVSVAAIVALTAIGTNVNTIFNTIKNKLVVP